MTIFETIKNAIFGHAAAAPAPAAAGPATGSAPAAPSPTAAPAPAATPAVAALSAADLHSLLVQLSAKNPQKLNWQTSIVDLMKLVGLDPSLANRKQLAQELGYTGDMADSATMNIWLHKEVMEKLAAGGGKVTPDLK
jgi:3-oxoacyl-ACP reductase-like protein